MIFVFYFHISTDYLSSTSHENEYKETPPELSRSQKSNNKKNLFFLKRMSLIAVHC